MTRESAGVIIKLPDILRPAGSGQGGLAAEERTRTVRFPGWPFVFKEKDMKKVAVIMGSASDRQVAGQAAELLASYGVPHIVRVCSAHRTPEAVREFALSARDEGFGAIIAVAGMAAHLAGAIAANTTLPVVGVPVASGGLGGLDALLSTVQMPSGIPVATVAVNGAKNAALLCVQMLAVEDQELAAKLQANRQQMAQDARLADLQVAREYEEEK